MIKNIVSTAVKALFLLLSFAALVALNFFVWSKDREQEKLIVELQQELRIQQQENDKIAKTNEDLKQKILSLKRGGYEMIEEEARNNWGMVGENETFFHIEEKKGPSQ